MAQSSQAQSGPADSVEYAKEVGDVYVSLFTKGSQNQNIRENVVQIETNAQDVIQKPAKYMSGARFPPDLNYQVRIPAVMVLKRSSTLRATSQALIDFFQDRSRWHFGSHIRFDILGDRQRFHHLAVTDHHY